MPAIPALYAPAHSKPEKRGKHIRLEHRLTHLIPPPVRKIPILIGGIGIKRTLPLVARHADIVHTFLADVAKFRRRNDILKQRATDVGRDESLIERCIAWTGQDNTDALLTKGVSLFITEIHPTDDGYGFTELKVAARRCAAGVFGDECRVRGQLMALTALMTFDWNWLGNGKYP